MKQLPFEATPDDFIDAIYEETGDINPCPFCGHDEWAALPSVPMGITGLVVRDSEGVGDNDSGVTGFFAVGLSCTKCGFIRLHQVKSEGEWDAEESA